MEKVASVPRTAHEAARVLVVDDDDQVRRIVVRQVASLGYRVLEASNGLDALDILARDADFDLLLIDLNMPDMDGQAVAVEARHLRADLGILFTSGQGEAADSEGEHFLMKPYRKKELAEKIREVLEGL
jgi:CheY-like chemotaxis protein